MKNTFLIYFLFVLTTSFAQDDALLDRLQAIINSDITFYNIDGYAITSQTYNYSFTEKNLKKVYRKYSIKRNQEKIKDEQIPYQNYSVVDDDIITDKLIQNNSYYFIEDKYKRVTIIQFSAINKRDKDFERSIVELIIEKNIPKKNYASSVIDSIDFAGRKIKLGNSCNWTNINTVQCPYNGEMNWSIHKDLEDAKITVDQQYEITKANGNGKIISEELVDIIFEGTETKARKIVYDFTGITSFLASMSGGKTLTVYYVACPIRDNYVSCVLSFWNNDNITKNGLSPLLNKVMSLKK